MFGIAAPALTIKKDTLIRESGVTAGANDSLAVEALNILEIKRVVFLARRVRRQRATERGRLVVHFALEKRFNE